MYFNSDLESEGSIIISNKSSDNDIELLFMGESRRK